MMTMILITLLGALLGCLALYTNVLSLRILRPLNTIALTPYVRPVVKYAIAHCVWSPHFVSFFKRIESVQQRIFRKR